MKNNQKFLSGFLLGAAAGAVVTVFLQSDKGQKFIDSAKSGIKDVSSELDGVVENWLNKGRRFLANLRTESVAEDVYDYEEIFS